MTRSDPGGDGFRTKITPGGQRIAVESANGETAGQPVVFSFWSPNLLFGHLNCAIQVPFPPRGGHLEVPHTPLDRLTEKAPR